MRQRPAGATSTGDGEQLPGAVNNGGDEATEAGGGNLHRGRGATAWGRKEWRRRRDRGRRGATRQRLSGHPSRRLVTRICQSIRS